MHRRVDSEVDQRTLESFIDSFFSSRAYETGFQLVSGEEGLSAPEGARLQDYIKWATSLPEREPPSWLALPANSEQLLAVQEGQVLTAKLRKMRSLSDEEETVAMDTASRTLGPIAGVKSPTTATSLQPSWMRSLRQTCETLKAMLPATLKAEGLLKAADKDGDALSRFFAREEALGKRLLKTIHGDLQDLLNVCNGQQKQTNRLRDLIEIVNKGEFANTYDSDLD